MGRIVGVGRMPHSAGDEEQERQSPRDSRHDLARVPLSLNNGTIATDSDNCTCASSANMGCGGSKDSKDSKDSKESGNPGGTAPQPPAPEPNRANVETGGHQQRRLSDAELRRRAEAKQRAEEAVVKHGEREERLSWFRGKVDQDRFRAGVASGP